ncbi:chemotaxis protein CheR [Donghicola sp. C2-DW-16]|uniref:Chemotaxis protein methyltransferase n=1 Tax=Donghicola mangrovi TaxID=2729614 RepID=A0A850Q6N6_9RHOB|nr:CheR family methyltransferase [Donghicola mangrovi]NVO24613.1 chemotaxis protein CheR [Donghicola mangrovi]NVO28842.1 chemotaxis protein CheR [Donghicola mangrovi]
MSPATETAEDSRKARFRAIVTQATGIQMPASKQSMIEGRMRRRFSSLGLSNMDAYLEHLFEQNALKDELPHIVDLMSTNKTDFFREPAHFKWLMHKIIPEHPAGQPFKMWSAASSSGQEAYTAAMLLSEHARKDTSFKYGILGTDISQGIVDEARAGVYSEDQLLDIPEALIDRYFVMGHNSKGLRCGRVVKTLRQRVRFEQMNLIHGNYPVDTNLDVIFLRNVLIYFDVPTQTRVIRDITDHLKIGGHLFVGHSESMVVTDSRLKQVSFAVFKKERAT